jgi:hypothetical protein
MASTMRLHRTESGSSCEVAVVGVEIVRLAFASQDSCKLLAVSAQPRLPGPASELLFKNEWKLL